VGSKRFEHDHVVTKWYDARATFGFQHADFPRVFEFLTFRERVRSAQARQLACRPRPGFHPDGRRLATGGRDRAVWLWDLERGEEATGWRPADRPR